MSIAADHDRWADSLGAYLLEGLPDAEREGFEAHLRTCAVCTEDVVLLQVASDALPASVEQVDPPAELKDRIMAIVRAEAELLAAAGPEADRPVRETARSRARSRLRMGGWSLRPGFALAAVALLLIVGGLSGALLSRDAKPVAERAITAKVDRSRASARLVLHETDSKLEIANLEAPPRGYVYQVWLKRPGGRERPTSALFTPRNDGSASVAVPGSLRGVEKVLVTAERAGGSERPTRQPVITARLS